MAHQTFFISSGLVICFLKSFNGTRLCQQVPPNFWVFFVCVRMLRIEAVELHSPLAGIKTNLPSDFLCVAGMKRRAWTALNSLACRFLCTAVPLSLIAQSPSYVINRARSGNWDGAIKWPRWLLAYCLSRGKKYTHLRGERERWTLTFASERCFLRSCQHWNGTRWMNGRGLHCARAAQKKEWRNASGIWLAWYGAPMHFHSYRGADLHSDCQGFFVECQEIAHFHSTHCGLIKKIFIYIFGHC